MIDGGRRDGASAWVGLEERRRLSPFAGIGIGALALSAAVLTAGAVSGALPLGPLLTWLLSMAAAGVVAVAALSIAQVRRLRNALVEERRRLQALMEPSAGAPADAFETGKASSFAARH